MLGLYDARNFTIEGVQERVNSFWKANATVQQTAAPKWKNWPWHDTYTNLNYAPINRPHQWMAESAMPDARHTLTLQQVQSIVSPMANLPKGVSPSDAALNFDALGGAVADFSAQDTAFPHRSAPFSMQFLVSYTTDADTEQVQQWLEKLVTGTGVGKNTGAYRNYPASNMQNALARFYGVNLQRLVALKRKHDPGNMFSACRYSLLNDVDEHRQSRLSIE